MEEYLHGECVAMGMLYFIEDDELRELDDPRIETAERADSMPHMTKRMLYERLLADKKAGHDGITVVKVKTLGTAELETISYEEIKRNAERMTT